MGGGGLSDVKNLMSCDLFGLGGLEISFGFFHLQSPEVRGFFYFNDSKQGCSNIGTQSSFSCFTIIR